MAQLEMTSRVPKLQKFLCMNLKIGLTIWSAFESIFWLVLLCLALNFGSAYISGDLLDFIDATEENFYFKFVFGHADYVDHKTRMRFLFVHYVLVQVFAIYLLVNLILFVGILRAKRRCFTPYFWFDAAIVCLVIFFFFFGISLKISTKFLPGMIHLFVVVFVFTALKLYVRCGLISLQKNYKTEAKSGGSGCVDVDLNII